jgi:hypothetical protein
MFCVAAAGCVEGLQKLHMHAQHCCRISAVLVVYTNVSCKSAGVHFRTLKTVGTVPMSFNACMGAIA